MMSRLRMRMQPALMGEPMLDPPDVRAVDVDVTFVGIDFAAQVHAGLQPPKPENAARDEIRIGFFAADLRKVPPVGARDSKTIPGGCPAPIRSAISCRPRGVPREFFKLEGGRREVDIT
jgi:hypothetical protein